VGTFPDVSLQLPPWVSQLCSPGNLYPAREERMGLVIELARHNVVEATGGPFGAAVFDLTSGALIAPGVNLVTTTNIALAHAEMVAIAIAGRVLGSFDLSTFPSELVASTEPCAMCLGTVPWSGVQRLVCGALDEDARAIGFDEGDKPEQWSDKLRSRGIEVITGVRRQEAAEVLTAYAASGGVIYNGRRA
jgi:tRNA(Arg) A34 adenosine deaminase TadA